MSVAVIVSIIVVVVVVSVILGTNVLHLVDRAALWAALDWALAGHLRRGALVMDMVLRGGSTYSEPGGDVGVGRGAGAASVLLIAEGLDHDRVGHGSCDINH